MTFIRITFKFSKGQANSYSKKKERLKYLDESP